MKRGRPKTGRQRELKKVLPINMEIDPLLKEALELCAAKERRTKKSIVVFALEQYLGKAGLWPPK